MKAKSVEQVVPLLSGTPDREGLGGAAGGMDARAAQLLLYFLAGLS